MSGTCVGSTRDCGMPGEMCLISECDETTDMCRLQLNPDGTPCVDNVIKPYMMMILDNSGSMDQRISAGTNSCGRERTRMSDAKCALTNLVASNGDVVFGLERYKETCTGSCTGTCPADCGTGGAATCPSTCNSCTCNYLNCGACDPSAATVGVSGCPSNGSDADQGEILSPIVDDTQPNILKWIDYTCNGCGLTSGNPELSSDTWTPLAGSLRGCHLRPGTTGAT